MAQARGLRKPPKGSPMRFGGLEIPWDVISAQDKSNLVIFAGAGVSMGSPALLPSFKKLVDQICNVLPYDDSEPLEKVLGRHFDHGVNVHSQARVIIKNGMNQETDSATTLHRSIPRLFKRGKPGSIRIVTTNFDTNLSRTVPDNVTRYSAPALPLSEEFSGLVYLHGSIEDESTLVLTDKDFAKAYMTEGWAREFILNLYKKYTVLFIGYSHEDQLVSYLARGMNLRDKKVFAFSADSEKDLAKWGHLGITPIPFPDTNYHALEVGVKKWADEAQSDFFQRKERFLKILELGVPDHGTEHDGFLKRYLMTQGITEEFTKLVSGSNWCAWVVVNGLGDFIHKEIETTESFYVHRPWRGSEFHLGKWLVRHFVSDVKELNRALKKHGHGMSWPLTQALLDAIGIGYACSEKDLGYLCNLVLTECSHVMIRNAHTQLLEVCVRSGFYNAALLVLRELLKPKLGMDLYYPDSEEDQSIETEYFELNFTGKMLLEYCLEVDESFADDCCREIFDICIGALSSVEEMNQGAMEAVPYSWFEVRTVSYGEELSHTPLSGISSLATTCLERMLQKSLIPEPLSYATYLAGSRSPIVRRIAVHLIQIAPELSNEERVSWLQSCGLVFSYQEYHEVFLLIHRVLSDTDDTGVEAILGFLNDAYVTRTEESAGSTDAFLLDYFIHLAYYLSVKLHTSEVIQKFYRSVQGITDCSPSRVSAPEYPSEGRETEEYFRAELKAKSLSDFIHIASMLSLSAKTEYLHQLWNEVAQSTARALEALAILREADETPDVHVTRTVLGSLAGKHMDTKENYEKYLALLDSGRFFYPFHLSEIYSVYQRAGHHRVSDESLLLEFKVCRAFWVSEKSGTVIDTPYPLHDEDTALSFMSSVLCRIVYESAESELRTAALQLLEGMITCRELSLIPLFRGLGENLHQLFAIDKEWSIANLIPLFSPSNSSNEVAEALWSGFLNNVTDGNGEMDLLEPYLIESCKAGLISSESSNFNQMLHKRLFRNHSIELEEAMVSAFNDKGLALEAIHIIFEKDMSAQFDKYWSEWVREYFTNRLRSRVKPVGIKEFSEVLMYAIENPQVYEDLGELLKAYKGPFEKRADGFARASSKSGFHKKYPSEALMYLSGMVASESYKVHEIGKRVLNVVEEILSENPDEFDKALPVIELYGMAGVPDAKMVYRKYNKHTLA